MTTQHNSRTGLEELSTEECWRLLGEHVVGRLAVSINHHPDIFPVNYRVKDGTILVQTAAGLKLAAATLGPSVAFEVDVINEEKHTGWSVVVHGPAEQVEQLEELLDLEDEGGVDTWAESEKTRYFCIRPTEVTGRRVPTN